MRSFWVLPLLVLVLAGPSMAVARTWTDNHGKQINAKFVRVFNGKVILERGSQVISMPLSRLSAEDREYVRQKTGSGPQASSVPSALSQVPAQGRSDSTEDSKEASPSDDPRSLGKEESSPSRRPKTRTWTDSRGRQMRAKFVRVEGGKAVLLKAGKDVSVPLTSLSAADREYVRQRTEDSTPSPESSISKASSTKTPHPAGRHDGPWASKDSVSRAEEKALSAGKPKRRTWVDSRGRKALGQFVRMHEGKVIILKPSGILSVSPFELCEADQQYVKELLDARGESHLFPEKPKGYEVAAVSPGRRFNRVPPLPSIPRTPPRFSIPSRLQTTPPPSHVASSQPRHNPLPDVRSSSFAHGPGPVASRPGYGIRPPDISPEGLNDPPQFSQTPSMQEYGRTCSNCGKGLPAHIGAGDRCPHCKVYFDYQENADGTYTNAKGARLPGWWVAVGGVGGLFVAVVVVLRVLLLFRRDD